MKKYNLSKIMKRAWEMVKNAGFGISAALKRAWKEAKEGGKMTGTEKQISFASALIEKMNEQFDLIVADCKIKNPEKVSMWESCKSGYNKIMSESYAGNVIDALRGLDETSYQTYYKGLMYNVRHSSDKMCGRILSEVYGK